jgi:hypothetical protein
MISLLFLMLAVVIPAPASWVCGALGVIFGTISLLTMDRPTDP